MQQLEQDLEDVSIRGLASKNISIIFHFYSIFHQSLDYFSDIEKKNDFFWMIKEE